MLVNKKKFDIVGNKTLETRCASIRDAKNLIDAYKTACTETRNLSREPDEFNISLDMERVYIRTMNDAPRQVLLLAVVDGEIAGSADISSVSSLQRDKHRCSLGIMLKNRFTGLGIGTILITELFELAKQLEYEQIELNVVANNIGARKLYEKLGFEQTGLIPHGQKYKDGSYDDIVSMIKFL
jgi:RimJ/RimL family protein N-acetyltransferase